MKCFTSTQIFSFGLRHFLWTNFDISLLSRISINLFFLALNSYFPSICWCNSTLSGIIRNFHLSFHLYQILFLFSLNILPIFSLFDLSAVFIFYVMSHLAILNFSHITIFGGLISRHPILFVRYSLFPAKEWNKRFLITLIFLSIFTPLSNTNNSRNHQ